jgi:hypothetical protein
MLPKPTLNVSKKYKSEAAIYQIPTIEIAKKCNMNKIGKLGQGYGKVNSPWRKNSCVNVNTVSVKIGPMTMSTNEMTTKMTVT